MEGDNHNTYVIWLFLGNGEIGFRAQRVVQERVIQNGSENVSASSVMGEIVKDLTTNIKAAKHLYLALQVT